MSHHRPAQSTPRTGWSAEQAAAYEARLHPNVESPCTLPDLEARFTFRTFPLKLGQLLHTFPESFVVWSSTARSANQFEKDPAFEEQWASRWPDGAITVEEGDGTVNRPYLVVCPAYRVKLASFDLKNGGHRYAMPKKGYNQNRERIVLPGPNCFLRAKVLSSADPFFPPAILLAEAIKDQSQSGSSLLARLVGISDDKLIVRWQLFFAAGPTLHYHFNVEFCLRRRAALEDHLQHYPDYEHGSLDDLVLNAHALGHPCHPEKRVQGQGVNVFKQRGVGSFS